MNSPRAILRALRPRQWTKNLAALAALIFAKSAFHGPSVLRALCAVVSFCLVASGVYVLNDWIDREKDRLHPEKRRRPIAAGLIGGGLAAAMVAVCWAAGLGLAFWVNFGFGALVAAYVVMQIAYSNWLKRLVIVDVLIIAIGFVMRVVGGGFAIGVPVSNWLYLCTMLLAVFLGFAKRRNELASLSADASAHRANLSEYSIPMLDQMISVVAAACIVAYGLYSVSAETVAKVGSDRMKYTVPFVIYGIFRYLFLVHKRNAGGSPERVLLSDMPMIVNLAFFVGVAGWVLYLPRG